MIEVLWHGRGGQGAFTAARLLGAAATLTGKHYALAFPSFGPERRGAPMRAFTKISEEPIGDRSALAKADYVVYLDGTLLPENWASELKPGGLCLVNAPEGSAAAGKGAGRGSAATGRGADEGDAAAQLIALDADGISQEMLGRPIPNTVFLGALAALESGRGGAVSCDDVEEAIRQYMPEKLHAKNIAIVQQVFEQVSGLDIASAVQGEGAEEGAPASTASPDASTAATSAASLAAKKAEDAGEGSASGASVAGKAKGADQRGAAAGASVAPQRQPHSAAAHMPQLRTAVPAVKDYAHTTCFTAGYLTQTNAGWRNKRPVVDEALCTGCLQCYMVCPDGVIYKVQGACNKAGVSVAIDLDFCKGCGVCANACKFDALHMANEQEQLACEQEFAAREEKPAAGNPSAAANSPAANNPKQQAAEGQVSA